MGNIDVLGLFEGFERGIDNLQPEYNGLRGSYLELLEKVLKGMGRPIRLRTPIPICNGNGESQDVEKVLLDRNGRVSIGVGERVIPLQGYGIESLNTFLGVLSSELLRYSTSFDMEINGIQ